MLKRLFLTPNVAWWDRILRVIPALIAVWAWSQNLMIGPLAIAFGLVSGMLLVTSLTGTCSIYEMFGLSTLPRRTSQRP